MVRAGQSPKRPRISFLVLPLFICLLALGSAAADTYSFSLNQGNVSDPGLAPTGPPPYVLVESDPELKGISDEILRVDTGDTKIDDILRGYIRVVADYNEIRLIKIE